MRRTKGFALLYVVVFMSAMCVILSLLVSLLTSFGYPSHYFRQYLGQDRDAAMRMLIALGNSKTSPPGALLLETVLKALTGEDIGVPFLMM